MNVFSIGKFNVSQVNLANTLDFIKKSIDAHKYGYICVSNALPINPEYCAIQNNSLLTVPDGKPLVWIAHNMGY